MNQELPAVFSDWESFYVIVGSSAAALTGLQFVVVALVAESRAKTSSDQINAFATPTIVHFCEAFFIAAALSAPWHSIVSGAVVIGIAALVGLFYSALVTRRARRQTGYVLVLEDWIWHTALPFVAYAMLLSAAITLTRQTVDALFGIGVASILLIFIGIHNAWDTVVYVTAERMGKQEPES